MLNRLVMLNTLQQYSIFVFQIVIVVAKKQKVRGQSVSESEGVKFKSIFKI